MSARQDEQARQVREGERSGSAAAPAPARNHRPAAPLRDPLLRTRAVADYLGVSPETVLRRYRAGELPGVRLASNVLRFRESAVEAWLEERSTSGDRVRA